MEVADPALVEQLTVKERRGKYCFRFWLAGPGYDRNIFTPQALTASIEYIHRNPVKRILRQTAVDYKWSIARFHQEQLVEADLPSLTRLDSIDFDCSGIQIEHS